MLSPTKKKKKKRTTICSLYAGQRLSVKVYIIHE